jgi:hypothetical protein
MSIPSFADENKLSGLMIFKNDYVVPRKSTVNSMYSNTVNIYLRDGWIGAGVDATYTKKSDYLNIKPFITLGKGPLRALAGYSELNSGARYAQAGVWYINTHNKVSMILDLRNFWTLDRAKSPGYLDFWVHLSHPIGDKFYAGIEAEYVHWWDKKPHDWFYAGPLVGYKLTKNLSIYARVAREFDMKPSKNSATDRFRIALKYVF